MKRKAKALAKQKPSRPLELPNSFYDAVYRVVRDIPRGRVMTYGQIAAVLGVPRAAKSSGR